MQPRLQRGKLTAFIPEVKSGCMTVGLISEGLSQKHSFATSKQKNCLSPRLSNCHSLISAAECTCVTWVVRTNRFFSTRADETLRGENSFSCAGGYCRETVTNAWVHARANYRSQCRPNERPMNCLQLNSQ